MLNLFSWTAYIFLRQEEMGCDGVNYLFLPWNGYVWREVEEWWQ